MGQVECVKVLVVMPAGILCSPFKKDPQRYNLSSIKLDRLVIARRKPVSQILEPGCQVQPGIHKRQGGLGQNNLSPPTSLIPKKPLSGEGGGARQRVAGRMGSPHNCLTPGANFCTHPVSFFLRARGRAPGLCGGAARGFGHLPPLRRRPGPAAVGSTQGVGFDCSRLLGPPMPLITEGGGRGGGSRHSTRFRPRDSSSSRSPKFPNCFVLGANFCTPRLSHR